VRRGFSAFFLRNFRNFAALQAASLRTRTDGDRSTVRMAFKQIFELSDGSFAQRGLSVAEFMGLVEDFLHHLTFHHGIEEQNVIVPLYILCRDVRLITEANYRHIFPILKQRMPHFQIEHQEEHDAIHTGMHNLEVRTVLPVLLSITGTDDHGFAGVGERIQIRTVKLLSRTITEEPCELGTSTVLAFGC